MPQAPGAHARLLFGDLRERHAAAELACGGAVRRTYEIAGRRVELRFAGPALVPGLTRALEHLRSTEGGRPDLTLLLFDTASTGVEAPERPEAMGAHRANGELPASEDGRVVAAYTPGNALAVFDRDARLGVYWRREAAEVPAFESAAPLRALINWWLPEERMQLVHAAAVGGPDGGVLLAGPAGAGKSTTALSCVAAGMGYAADDYCAIELAEEPIAHSLYDTGKAVRAGLGRLPGLNALVPDPERLDDAKVVYFLHEHAPTRLVRRIPIRALLVPKVVGGRDTRVEEASPAAALAALAPTTLFQLPNAGRGSFQALTRLVRSVPCRHLLLGTDAGGVVAAVRAAVG